MGKAAILIVIHGKAVIVPEDLAQSAQSMVTTCLPHNNQNACFT